MPFEGVRATSYVYRRTHGAVENRSFIEQYCTAYVRSPTTHMNNFRGTELASKFRASDDFWPSTRKNKTPRDDDIGIS